MVSEVLEKEVTRPAGTIQAVITDMNDPDVDRSATLVMYATMKINSAFINLDEISGDKRFRQLLKKDLLGFEQWFISLSKSWVNNMASKENEQEYINILMWLDEYNGLFKHEDSFFLNLSIFAARCQSAINDLKKIKGPKLIQEEAAGIIAHLEYIFRQPYFTKFHIFDTATFGKMVAKFDNLFIDE